MHPAILGKLFLFGRVTKFGTSSQFNGILPECLLHTVYIVRLLLTCMYPFIQEQIGYISQQQRAGIINRHQPAQKIVCRMAAIILVTFRQWTDIYQIIRFQYDKRRGINSIPIYRNIQQIKLGISPKFLYGFFKFMIYTGFIINNPYRFISYYIYRMYIQIGIIGIIKAYTDAADVFHLFFFPWRCYFLLGKNWEQLQWNILCKHLPICVCHCTQITQELFFYRRLTMVQNIIGSQTKGM